MLTHVASRLRRLCYLMLMMTRMVKALKPVVCHLTTSPTMTPVCNRVRVHMWCASVCVAHVHACSRSNRIEAIHIRTPLPDTHTNDGDDDDDVSDDAQMVQTILVLVTNPSSPNV